MKKIKTFIGLALIAALAFACLAFTACGDPFNIDTSKEATEDEFAAFQKSVTEANGNADSVTDSIQNASFKIEMKYSMEMWEPTVEADNVKKNEMSMKYDIDGVINVSANPSAKLKGKGDLHTDVDGINQDSKSTLECVLVDGVMYVSTTVDGTTAKIKIDYSFDDILGGLAEKGEVYYADSSTGGESSELEAFIAELKAAFSSFGFTSDPKVYIQDKTMKVVLGSDDYFGIAYNDEWKPDALDVVLKDLSIGDLNLNLELKMRATDAQTITAPSDAADYTSGSLFG